MMTKSNNDINDTDVLTIDVTGGWELWALHKGLDGYRLDCQLFLDSFTRLLAVHDDGKGGDADFKIENERTAHGMLTEFVPDGAPEACRARDITRKELLEGVPGELHAIMTFALDRFCGDCGEDAWYELDDQERDWLRELYKRQIEKLKSSIASAISLRAKSDTAIKAKVAATRSRSAKSAAPADAPQAEGGHGAGAV